MTERNLKKELQYFTYTDMERGNDITSLDYPALIGLLEELMSRIETLDRGFFTDYLCDNVVTDLIEDFQLYDYEDVSYPIVEIATEHEIQF